MLRRGIREGGVPAAIPSEDGSPAVLVADDDRDVRTMLRTLLELDGHEVLEAPDGDMAWKLIEEYSPAVVVADIQMPGLDGLQICRLVKERGLEDVKVIVYTAGMATEQESQTAGCDGYLLKTAPIANLRDAVRKMVSLRPAANSH
jgi:CheY-like chemotaxis protein